MIICVGQFVYTVNNTRRTPSFTLKQSVGEYSPKFPIYLLQKAMEGLIVL